MNGRVDYTEQFQIGSVASYTCDVGFEPGDGTTQICTLNGWSGSDFTCKG